LPGPKAQRASQKNLYYPALQQAVDNYLAERHQADGFSGIGLHVSFSDRRPQWK
jgi:hypothetical protein